MALAGLVEAVADLGGGESEFLGELGAGALVAPLVQGEVAGGEFGELVVVDAPVSGPSLIDASEELALLS